MINELAFTMGAILTLTFLTVGRFKRLEARVKELEEKQPKEKTFVL